MLSPKLDYLFIAVFKDGSRYYQDKFDRSRDQPLTRSSFFDVQEQLADVSRFILTDGRRSHCVFLDDGHFVTEGQEISNPHRELINYRLIYFRRIEQSFEAGVAAAPRVVAYFIGWQANDARGQNYKMLLEIPSTGSQTTIRKE